MGEGARDNQQRGVTSGVTFITLTVKVVRASSNRGVGENYLNCEHFRVGRVEKKMEKKSNTSDDEEEGSWDEIAFAVEKGSPADKVLQVLAHHGWDAEVTSLEVKGGRPGEHQLVKVDGVICDKQAGVSFTIWAIILPSGMAYVLSAQDPGETDIPLWPRLYQLFLKVEGEADNEKERRESP